MLFSPILMTHYPIECRTGGYRDPEGVSRWRESPHSMFQNSTASSVPREGVSKLTSEIRGRLKRVSKQHFAPPYIQLFPCIQSSQLLFTFSKTAVKRSTPTIELYLVDNADSSNLHTLWNTPSGAKEQPLPTHNAAAITTYLALSTGYTRNDAHNQSCRGVSHTRNCFILMYKVRSKSFI